MNKNYQNLRRWTKNWSGRGTATLDYMEKASDKLIYDSASQLQMKECLPMLRDLLRIYPEAKFYQSLAKHAAKYKNLSFKQMACIQSDYNKYTALK